MPRVHLVVGTTAGLVLRLGDDLARHDGEPVGIHGFIPRMPRAKPLQRKISRAGVSTAGHVGRRRDAPAQAGAITALGPCNHRPCPQRVAQRTAGDDSNEKPTGDAAVQKSYYIPYAYTFLIHRADRGLIGRKACALKKLHCGPRTSVLSVPVLLRRNRRLSRELSSAFLLYAAFIIHSGSQGRGASAVRAAGR